MEIIHNFLDDQQWTDLLWRMSSRGFVLMDSMSRKEAELLITKFPSQLKIVQNGDSADSVYVFRKKNITEQEISDIFAARVSQILTRPEFPPLPLPEGISPGTDPSKYDF